MLKDILAVIFEVIRFLFQEHNVVAFFHQICYYSKQNAVEQNAVPHTRGELTRYCAKHHELY